MSRDDSALASYSWEKEHAPRMTAKHVAFVAFIYVSWMAFLAVVAVQRWFGSLQ
jgi:hypothetical protein